MSTDDTKVHVNLKFDNDFYTANIEKLQRNRVLSKLVSDLLKVYFENETFRDSFNTYNENYSKSILKYLNDIDSKSSDVSTIVNMFNYIPNQEESISSSPKEIINSTAPSAVENEKINEVHEEPKPKQPATFLKLINSTKKNIDVDISVESKDDIVIPATAPSATENEEVIEVEKEKPKVPAGFSKFIKSM